MKKILRSISVFSLLCALFVSATSCVTKHPEEKEEEENPFMNDTLSVEDYTLPIDFFIDISISDGGEALHMHTAKVGTDWQTVTALPGGGMEWRFYRYVEENRYRAYQIENEGWVYKKTVNFSGFLEDSAAALIFLIDPSSLPESSPIEKLRTTGLHTYETLEYTYTNANATETILETDKYHPNIMLFYSCGGLVREAVTYDRSAGEWNFMHQAGMSFYMPPGS